MSAPFPSPGEMIGRFRVLAQLGAGGMGVVYDALEVNLERRVALKVISPMYAGDPDFRGRFISEARALASLDSPHVVQVYAHGEEDGYLYIATQLVPDGDLGRMITRWGPPPLGKAAELIEQVASGLADAHAAGLVHRDIKPANVLVRRRGSATVHAYLGDFGIARRVDAEATRVGTAIGTPSSMAPELHQGVTANVTTDIYAVGCLLWVVLTGQAPYAGSTEFEIITGHVSRPVPQLAGSTPLVEAVNRVLRISMAKEPGHRYRAALDLRDDLREIGRMTDAPDYLQPAVTASAALEPTRLPGAHTPTPTPAGPTGPPPSYQPTHQPTHQPAYPPFPQPVPPRSRKGLLIGVAAGLALLAIGGGTALALNAGGDDPDGDPTAGPTDGRTGSTADPTGDPTGTTSFADGEAADIVAAAEKEMSVLDSVTLSGTIESDGKPGTFDFTITSSGDCAGKVGLAGGTAEMRRVDGIAYLKPDRAFFEASAGLSGTQLDLVLGQIGDRWIKGDEGDAEGFDQLCDIDELVGSGSTGGDPVYTKGEVTDVDGRPAIAIDQTGGDVTAYVAVDDPHYLLKVEQAEDDGVFVFSKFDEEFTVAAPPASDVYTP
ncbi:serine/threonine-protein kinase [Nocardioides plantarum]|uniref:non-specific serine/threonine protein kinase n=1 Tax=Nocardioides plantarum TaxID=29299 RepID=A0ABV5KEN1_9ACTN|nr:serine/threonine-protein kinase [Nocardioides plantarum]